MMRSFSDFAKMHIKNEVDLAMVQTALYELNVYEIEYSSNIIVMKYPGLFYQLKNKYALFRDSALYIFFY